MWDKSTPLSQPWLPPHGENVQWRQRYQSIRRGRSMRHSAVDGGERSVTRADHLILGERAHSTRWIGGWLEPRANLDGQFSKKKISCLCSELDYIFPVHILVTTLYTPGSHSNLEDIWVLKNRKQKKEYFHFFLRDYISMLKFLCKLFNALKGKFPKYCCL
jgi:hypothetical protein